MSEAVSQIYADLTHHVSFGEAVIYDKLTKVPIKVKASATSRLFSFNGVEDISLGKLMMIFSMKMALIYEDTLRLHMEDLNRSTGMLETSSQVAAILCNEDHDSYINVMNDETYFVSHRLSDGTIIKMSIYDFMTKNEYLGISDLPDPKKGSDSHWIYSEVQDAVKKLNKKMDELNTLNQEQLVDVQTTLNSMNLSYKYGFNLSKMILHGSRNMANNLMRL